MGIFRPFGAQAPWIPHTGPDPSCCGSAGQDIRGRAQRAQQVTTENRERAGPNIELVNQDVRSSGSSWPAAARRAGPYLCLLFQILLLDPLGKSCASCHRRWLMIWMVSDLRWSFGGWYHSGVQIGQTWNDNEV